MCKDTERWAGQIETRLGVVEGQQKEMLTLLHQMMQKGNGSKYVTYSFVREKVLVPVIVGGFTFFLFTFMPGLLVLVIVLLPRIADLLNLVQTP